MAKAVSPERWRIAAMLALAALALASPTASAQGLGTQPTAESNVLWAHHFEGGPWWLSNVRNDTGHAADGWGNAGPDADGTYTWVFTLDPPLSAPLRLDPAGKVAFDLYLGSNRTGGAGNVQVNATLRSDSTVVAATPAASVDYLQEYKRLSWNVTPNVTTLPAGSNLTLTVHAAGPHTIIALNLADAPGWTRVTLPVLPPPPPPPLHENLTGPEVRLRLDLASPTDQVREYRWPHPGGDADLSMAANGTAGRAKLTVRDGNGTLLLDTTLNGTVAPDTTRLTTPAPGNWTIRLEPDGYAGTLGLTITPVPEGPRDGKDSPAPAPPLTLAGLLAVALMVARRRRPTTAGR